MLVAEAMSEPTFEEALRILLDNLRDHKGDDCGALSLLRSAHAREVEAANRAGRDAMTSAYEQAIPSQQAAAREEGRKEAWLDAADFARAPGRHITEWDGAWTEEVVAATIQEFERRAGGKG